MLILRSAAPSPFARKVRIAAAVLELDNQIEVLAADMSDPEIRRGRRIPWEKFRRSCSTAASAIYDSAVIVEYLDFLAGGGKIIPATPPKRFCSLTQQALADGIMEAAVLIRYETLWREPDKRSEKWIAYQGDKIARGLATFEPALPEELSDIGTISLACALGYLDLRFEGAWRADHPGLVAWLDLFAAATPSFEETRFQG